MAQVLINDQYLHDIANSIRKMKGTTNPITPDSMAGEIREIDIGRDPDEHWVRPVNWPDYSQVDMTGFNGIYFTYDTTVKNGWCGLQATVSGGYKVERGQIQNGQLVVDKTTNVNSGANYIEMLPYTITGFIVYRITAQNPANAITRVGQVAVTAAVAGDGVTDLYWNQPVLERYGRLPNITSLYQWANTNVISDTIYDMAAITTFSSTWNTCYKIQNINLTGFSARPTTFYYAFRQCYNLRYVTTKNLVTSACTSLNLMFGGDVSIRYIDTTGWDTSKVTIFASVFESCHNLTKIDVSHFDTSSATTMTSMFYNCYRLRHIDVSGFDTSKVTTFANMFRGCLRLESVDVSNFDTGAATSMTYMFQLCETLEELDVTGFDTKNVTTMSYMFANMRNLKSLDCHYFDMRKVTDASYMFNVSSSLESVDISGWTCTALTTSRNMFDSCFCLEDLDTEGLTVGTAFSASNCFTAVFSNMHKVRRIDISGWDLSRLPASYASVFRYDYEVDTIIMPASFSTIAATFYGNCQSLRKLVLPNTNIVTLANVNAFGATPSGKIIYVPDNLVESYKTAPVWVNLTGVTFAPLSSFNE